MSARVAVAGASGYVGGEVLRLLHAHPGLELGTVTGHSSVGDTIGQHHAHLTPYADRRLVATTADELADHDVVVMALPHGASAALAAQLPEDVLVVDCGADHRLEDSVAWQQFYGGSVDADGADGWPGHWPYGLPELVHRDGTRQRDRLIGARRVAVPGCYPTAVTLAIAPAIAAGLADPGDVVAVAASGTTGAGRTTAAHLTHSEIAGSITPYGVGGVHRHVPEIEQDLGWAGGGQVRVSFTPVLVPTARGILATVSAPATAGVSAESLRAAYADLLADESFVHLLAPGRWPRTQDVVGSNSAHVQVAFDERAGRVVAVAAIDNLTKGTAGAALQCINLALGLPEVQGLPMIGVAP